MKTNDPGQFLSAKLAQLLSKAIIHLRDNITLGLFKFNLNKRQYLFFNGHYYYVIHTIICIKSAKYTSFWRDRETSSIPMFKCIFDVSGCH